MTSPANTSKARKAPAAKATPSKATTKQRTATRGVPVKVEKATKAATKRTVAPGRKASEVVTVTLPKGGGDPATRQEWDAMVLTAKAEHEAYLRWRRDGQPGGKAGMPKEPTLKRLQDLKASGVTRASLPEGEQPKAAKGTGRRVGTIPEGKTAAGLDRMDDAATVAWIRKADPKGEATVGGLHRQFRQAGYGANAKRFARLVEQARKAK